jgi:hypothetical protein
MDYASFRKITDIGIVLSIAGSIAVLIPYVDEITYQHGFDIANIAIT